VELDSWNYHPVFKPSFWSGIYLLLLPTN